MSKAIAPNDKDLLDMQDKETYAFKIGRERITLEFEFKKLPTNRDHIDWTDLSVLDKDKYPYEFSYTICIYENGRFSASGRESMSEYIENPLLKVLAFEFNMICSPWHLNDINAGTELQSYARDNSGLQNPEYEKVCDYLKAQGLYEHMGYKYGHKWLTKPLSAVRKELIKEKLTNAIQGHYKRLAEQNKTERLSGKNILDVKINVV